MSGYMTDTGPDTEYEVDRCNAGPALVLSAAFAGRLSSEKMQKILSVHRVRFKQCEAGEPTDKVVVKVKVTREGNPLEFVEPLAEFPSEAMLAQIVLVV